jgi:hypothetical protein
MRFLIIFILFASCSNKTLPTARYPNMIGDIDFDPKMDNKNFQVCNEAYIVQYFNNSEGLEYEGEKIAIEKEFTNLYNAKIVRKESGLVRIRFVVNCKGKTDRFRIIAMNENYAPHTFDSRLTQQLLAITKQLKGWKPKIYDGTRVDYYQYLIFKIKDGEIAEILP